MLTLMKNLPSNRQRGFTLLEALVAIVVAALGILGIVGVQMRTLTDTQTTVRRAQAIRLIEDLSERLNATPNALLNISAYVSPFNTTLTPSDCTATPCTQSQLQTYDVNAWKQTVKDTLPLGDANIFLAPADSADPNNPRQLGVMIAWRENERTALPADTAYKSDIDATGTNAASAAGTAAAGVTCPTGYTCHLQYLPVASRCIPYSDGIATITQFVCPGN
jgi:type IV pilus assembly protein PilV